MTNQLNPQVIGRDIWMEVKVVLEPRDYHRLRKKAVSEDVSMSELIQQVICEFLEKTER